MKRPVTALPFSIVAIAVYCYSPILILSCLFTYIYFLSLSGDDSLCNTINNHSSQKQKDFTTAWLYAVVNLCYSRIFFEHKSISNDHFMQAFMQAGSLSNYQHSMIIWTSRNKALISMKVHPIILAFLQYGNLGNPNPHGNFKLVY